MQTAQEIDTDGDRRLTLAEFMHSARVVGLALSREAAAAEFARVDEDGGGQLRFEEFCSWAASTHLLLDEEERAPLEERARRSRPFMVFGILLTVCVVGAPTVISITVYIMS